MFNDRVATHLEDSYWSRADSTASTGKMSSMFGGADANADLIIFDASKNERRLNEEFKVLQRKLKPKWKFVEYVF